MRTLLCFTMLILVALCQGNNTLALAVTLEFSPTSQIVDPGKPVTVDVVISGLAAGGPPSVGAFDLDVSFNPAILSSTGVTFGHSLGNPGLGEVLTASSLVPGVIDFAAVSLLSSEELDALQPARFSLANLAFSPVGVGTSRLTFSQVIVADTFGVTLDTDSRVGSVTVVPEPSSLFLFAPVLVAAIVTIWLRTHQTRREGLKPGDR